MRFAVTNSVRLIHNIGSFDRLGGSLSRDSAFQTAYALLPIRSTFGSLRSPAGLETMSTPLLPPHRPRATKTCVAQMGARMLVAFACALMVREISGACPYPSHARALACLAINRNTWKYMRRQGQADGSLTRISTVVHMHLSVPAFTRRSIHSSAVRRY